jgi:hypothetical protein
MCKDVLASIVTLLAEVEIPAFGALVARSLNANLVASIARGIMHHSALGLTLGNAPMGARALSVCSDAMRAVFACDGFLAWEKKRRRGPNSCVPFEGVGLVVRTSIVTRLAKIIVRTYVALVSDTFDGGSIAGTAHDARMNNLAQAPGLGWTAFVAAACVVQTLAMRTVLPGCTALGGRTVICKHDADEECSKEFHAGRGYVI